MYSGVPTAPGASICAYSPDAGLTPREPGEAPVHQVNLTEARHHDVVGLQVPMDDAAVVRVGHASQTLAKISRPSSSRSVDPRGREASRSHLKSEIPCTSFIVKYGTPLLIDRELVHRDDVRVLELPGNLRLRDEPVAVERLLGEPLVEAL
jgi:hypothetical protein